MKQDSKNLSLGNFLRQRRQQLNPEKLGFSAGLRRTPGLRREEVAERAGISVDWYVRLEQGRESLPSMPTVLALAHALQLTEVEKAHLTVLAKGAHQTPYRRESVPDEMKLIVENLNCPAYISDALWNILIWNKAAERLFGNFGKMPESERNILSHMFTEEKMKSLFFNWENEARRMLEQFRATYDRWPNDSSFANLVDKLTDESKEFRKWWAMHKVQKPGSGFKLLRHPKLGKVSASYATFQSNDDPNIKLSIYRLGN